MYEGLVITSYTSRARVALAAPSPRRYNSALNDDTLVLRAQTIIYYVENNQHPIDKLQGTKSNSTPLY